MFTVRVMGLPQQQGSKNPWGGEANKKLAPWRGHVTQTVGEEWEAAGRSLLLGPVELHVTFAFPRPKAHYRANGELKANAPHYKTSAPDLDKLVRAIGDALTARVFRDDAQVAVWRVEKVYDETTYATITIIDLQEVDDDAGRSAALGAGTNPGGSDS